MKKLILYFEIATNFIFLSNAMEEKKENLKDSLNNSQQWTFVNVPQNEGLINSHGSNSPIILPDTEPLDASKISQENDGEKENREQAIDTSQTVEQNLLGEDKNPHDPKSDTRLSSIHQMYYNVLEGITSNPWYQNKPVRYSAFIGTGTVTIGFLGLGYWYWKNK